jgi:hypothetical protein
MKNIHILPTDKPSRLFKFEDKLIKNDLIGLYDFQEKGYIPQNIYITSDEEIKNRCHVLSEASIRPLYLDGIINTASMLIKGPWNKIILTTDQDLINVGVQAIDEDFLEWFVQNPSCEKVEIEITDRDNDGYGIPFGGIFYKIIIPQEEPKQDWYCPKCQSYVSSESVTFEETHQICNTSVVIKEPKQSTKDRILSETPELVKQKVRETANKLVEPKQETLEEAALRLYSYVNDDTRLLFINGAKWQQQNIPICIYAENIYCHIENGVVIVEKKDKSVISYSEEDMIEFGKYLLQLSNSVMARRFNIKMLDLETGIKLTKDLLEQFKKEQDERNT